MNYKFHTPTKRKFRYLRRGWNGEGEQARRDALKKEFEKDRYLILKSGKL